MSAQETWLSRRVRECALLVGLLAFQGVAMDYSTAATTVAGDIIVKFKDDSSSGKLMSQIVRGAMQLKEAEKVAARLSQRLGVPLTPVRVTSGRELLLAIDRDRLTRDVLQRATRNSSVSKAEPVHAPAGVLPPREMKFVLDLQKGAAAEREASRRPAATADSAEIKTLVDDAAGDLKAAASASVDERGRLVLAIDMAALTTQVAKQLEQCTEVEYAQPNLMLKHTR